MKKRALILSLVATLCSMVAVGQGLSGESITGTYSSFCFDSVSGDLSGMEITILLGGEDYWVIHQLSEGAPSVPVLTRAVVHDSTIEFRVTRVEGSPVMYKGYVSQGRLSLSLNDDTHHTSLGRRPSYWQLHATGATCVDTTGNRAWRHYPYLYSPPVGFVPDSISAVNLAKTIWLPIYGSEVLRQEPFVARLHGDSVWTVEGSLEQPTDPKQVVLGGTAYIAIRKVDGRVLGVAHGE